MNLLARALQRLRRAPRRVAASDPSPSAITEVRAPFPRDLELRYDPRADGQPDAGEVVWGWVPYAEDPRQGKDRPLLVIASGARGEVFAMKMTSRTPADGDGHVPLGTGGWDRSGRASWLDIDQLYRVPASGVRREGAQVDARTFRRVAEALSRRFGWRLDR
jgi:hypothetical protein